MRTFGAELTGHALPLPRVELLRQLRTYRSGAPSARRSSGAPVC